MSQLNQHYVCTREEARAIIAREERFWMATCGCRERHGRCARSRHDLCLEFAPGQVIGAERVREISRDQVQEILREAEAKHLIVRPFRNEDRDRTAGFCFCCDDCCEYFVHPEGLACDKGAYVERTDRARCTDCGDCALVCYFGARKMQDGELAVDRDVCYGCGLCRDVCPVDAVEMAPR